MSRLPNPDCIGHIVCPQRFPGCYRTMSECICPSDLEHPGYDSTAHLRKPTYTLCANCRRLCESDYEKPALIQRLEEAVLDDVSDTAAVERFRREAV